MHMNLYVLTNLIRLANHELPGTHLFLLPFLSPQSWGYRCSRPAVYVVPGDLISGPQAYTGHFTS